MSRRHGRSKSIEAGRTRLLEGIGVPEPQPFVPDEFQKHAISTAANGKDTLVVAPTGSGKTYIATESIRAYLQMHQKSVYTTPLKALSNTKYNDLRALFEPNYAVGLLTGDRKIDTDADVVIATTEIYRNELYRSHERFSLVVLDEVHFIADPQRGPVWEETIILTPNDATLLMLSASISNAQEIVDWLQAVRGKECELIVETERPVELRYGFIHPRHGVLPLQDEKGNIFGEVSDYYSKEGTSSYHGKKGGSRRGAGRRGGGGGNSKGRRSSRGRRKKKK